MSWKIKIKRGMSEGFQEPKNRTKIRQKPKNRTKMDETANRNVKNRKTPSKFWENRKTAQKSPRTANLWHLPIKWQMKLLNYHLLMWSNLVSFLYMVRHNKKPYTLRAFHSESKPLVGISFKNKPFGLNPSSTYKHKQINDAIMLRVCKRWVVVGCVYSNDVYVKGL